MLRLQRNNRLLHSPFSTGLLRQFTSVKANPVLRSFLPLPACSNNLGFFSRLLQFSANSGASQNSPGSFGPPHVSWPPEEEQPGYKSPFGHDPGEEAFNEGLKLYLAYKNAEALPYFRKAATYTYPPAYLALICFCDVPSAEQAGNLCEAEKHLNWYQDHAAKANTPLAHYLLASCYEHGIGIKEDMVLAAKHYKIGADQGFGLSQLDLALLYHHGNGVEVNPRLAFYYMELAALQNIVIAQVGLGGYYQQGSGCPIDIKEALTWYKKAAELGHAEAYYLMAACYIRGDVPGGNGVPRNSKMAWYYTRKSAEAGYPLAVKMLKIQKLLNRAGYVVYALIFAFVLKYLLVYFAIL